MPHVNAGSSSGSGPSGSGGGGRESSGPAPPPAGSGSGGGGGGGGGSTSSSSTSSARVRDDPNDCDEVKLFKCEEDEGEGSSDDVMIDDKRDLIRSTEFDTKGRLSPLSPLSPEGYSGSGGGHSSSSFSKNGQSSSLRPDPTSLFGTGKLDGIQHPSAINPMGGWLAGHYFSNGSPLMADVKLRMGGFPLFPNGVEAALSQPPPAHMSNIPYPGLSRPYFGIQSIQYPYAGLPEVSQVSPWPQGVYPSISGAASPAGSAGYRPYPPIPTSIPSDFYRFSPALLPGSGLGGHPGLGHLVGNPGGKHHHHHHDPHLDNHRSNLVDQKSLDNHHLHHHHHHHGSKNVSDAGQSSNSQSEKKKPHIKKPLNAFMLYMKEMRAKVVAECTLKESAAINQILGRRWHSLNREEQSKYYEMARQERQLHMQLYPGWSARDNYGYGAKKKKRKKEKTSDGGNSMKKCRARYGLDQQNQWCKPCRRKKKCIRYLEDQQNGGVSGNGGANGVGNQDDNLGSAGSAGEPQSPDSDKGDDSDMETSSNMDGSGSSPSFIMTSPGMSITSPAMSLPSPAMTGTSILPSPSQPSPAVSLPSLQSPLTPSLSEDRHPLSNLSSISISSSSASNSILNNFTTNTASSSSLNGITSSSMKRERDMDLLRHHNSHNNHHSSSASSSPALPISSSYGKHSGGGGGGYHHPGSPSFGYGLPGLFNGSPGTNGGMINPYQFPFLLPHHLQAKPLGNPVGLVPQDKNNPLSISQLCNNSSASSSASSLSSNSTTSHDRSHKSSPHHNHERSRDRGHSTGTEGGRSSSGESNKANNNNAPVPTAPVIGVS